VDTVQERIELAYCNRCNKLSHIGAKHCACGNKKLREPIDNDAVFLVSLDFMHGRMLGDVLEQNDIPVLLKPIVMPLAFLTARTGQEANHVFVPYGALEKAKELLTELFASRDGEMNLKDPKVIAVPITPIIL